MAENPKFKEYHGMSFVLPWIKEAVGLNNRKEIHVNRPMGKINGWAVLALINGVDDVCERMKSCTDTISIVCALLLSAALPLMLSPSTCLTDNTIVTKTYAVILTVSITLYFTAILLSALLVSGTSASARDADKWRFILANSMLPTIIYTSFSFGCLLFGISIALGMYCVYGYGPSGFFLFSVLFVDGILVQIINKRFLIGESHAVHGWFKKYNSEFDLRIPFSELEKIASFDQINHINTNNRSSFQVFSPVNSSGGTTTE